MDLPFLDGCLFEFGALVVGTDLGRWGGMALVCGKGREGCSFFGGPPYLRRRVLYTRQPSGEAEPAPAPARFRRTFLQAATAQSTSGSDMASRGHQNRQISRPLLVYDQRPETQPAQFSHPTLRGPREEVARHGDEVPRQRRHISH